MADADLNMHQMAQWPEWVGFSSVCGSGRVLGLGLWVARAVRSTWVDIYSSSASTIDSRRWCGVW